MPPVVELSGISKSFLGTAALSDVSFDLRAGEIHALMGENGAGKSTLVKTLTGVYQPDSGSMRLNGEPISPHNPAESVALGISTVYQEVNLLPNLTVLENLVLGREPHGRSGIKWKQARVQAEQSIGRLGIDIDVNQPLSNLSIALQQMVAIARALDVSAKVLILDEPTSSLDSGEVEALFGVMRKLKSEGIGIIFVTHFIEQVYAISDRITILRNGKWVGTWETSQLDRMLLVSTMIGRDASSLSRETSQSIQKTEGAVLLKVSELRKRNWVADVNFEIGPGEVLGLAGLLGSGRTETARLLFGIGRADHGSIHTRLGKMSRWTPRRAISQRIGYCSEDRKNEGIFPELTLRENLLILMQVKRGWFRRLSRQNQVQVANELIEKHGISPADGNRQIQFLSGGNQQKALLARWLATDPQLLILDEPTRGIDVGAKFEIMAMIDSLREAGRSFVFISSELAEVVKSCSTVLVLRDRKQIGTLQGEEINEEAIVKEIAGK